MGRHSVAHTSWGRRVGGDLHRLHDVLRALRALSLSVVNRSAGLSTPHRGCEVKGCEWAM